MVRENNFPNQPVKLIYWHREGDFQTMTSEKRVWEILEAAGAGDKLSKTFDIFILSLIFLNVVAVIVGTVQSIQEDYSAILNQFEVFSVVVFTIEYLARIFCCVVKKNYSKAIRGRLRFMVLPMSLVDLFAILPFYLPFIGVDLRFIRILRLLRIVRVAKIGRYYSSLNLIVRVIRSKKEELILTSALMMMLLVMSSSLIYYCENPAQPELFPNIPATLWWSVITLTTVGYGDVYPVTTLGKFLASIIAILGIGMFALPTGILGAGFVEEIQKRKSKGHRCPHCGKEIE